MYSTFKTDIFDVDFKTSALMTVQDDRNASDTIPKDDTEEIGEWVSADTTRKIGKRS